MTYSGRKILAVLLMTILCFSVFVVAVAINNASTEKAYASPSDTYIDYKLFDYKDYLDNIAYEENFAYYMDGDDCWKSVAKVTTGSGKNKVTKYTNVSAANEWWAETYVEDDDGNPLLDENEDPITLYKYFGDKYPQELCDFNTNTGEWNNGPTAFDITAEKSEVAAGDYLMIAVYVQSSDGIDSGNIVFDFGSSGLNLTTASQVSEETTPIEDNDVIYVYVDDSIWDDMHNKSLVGTGIQFSVNDNAAPTTKVLAGFFAFKVRDNVTPVEIVAYDLGSISKCTSNIVTLSNNLSSWETSTPHEPNPAVTFVVAESPNQKALLDLTKVKINNANPKSTEATITIEGDDYDAIIANTQANSSSTSIALTLPTLGEGTISSVKYCIGDDCLSDKSLISTIVGESSGKYTISSSALSAWEPGTSVYALVEVHAQVGEETKQYVIEIPKAKDTEVKLAGLTVSGGTVCKLCTNGTATETTFVGTTAAYSLRCSKVDTTTLTFTPEFTNSYQSVTIGGSAAADGVAKNIDVSGNPSSISIVVTAQDTTKTKTYTINLVWLKDIVTLSDITVSVDPTSGPVSHMSVMTPSGTDKYILKGKDYVPYGSGLFQFTATVTSGSGATVKYSTNNSTFGTDLSNRQVAFSTGGTWPEETKFGYIEVTAEDGFTKKVYTLEVTRYGGDTDSGLKSSRTYYRLRSGSASYDPSSVLISDLKIQATGTQTDTTKEYTVEAVSDIAFAKKGVGIWATRNANTAKMTYKYKVGDGDWSSYIEMTDGNPTNDMNFSSTTTAETIYVDLLCTAQDANYTSTYHFTFTRKKASDDNTLDTGYVKLYNQSNAEIELKQNSDIQYETKNDVDWTTTSVSIKAKFNTLATASVTDEITTYNNITNDGQTSGFSFNATNYDPETKVIYLTITAEDGTPKEFSIIVNRAKADNTFTYDLLIESDSFVQIMSVSGAEPQAHVIARDFPYTENEFYVTITPRKITTKVRFMEKDSTRTLVTSRKKITIDSTGTNDGEIDGTIEFELETQATNTSTPNITITYHRIQGKSNTTFTYEVQGATGVHSAYSATASADGRTFTVESYPTKTETNKYWLQIEPSDETVKIYTTTQTVTSATDSHLSEYSGIAGSKQFDVDTILYVVIVPEVTYKYKVYAFNVKGQDYRSTENGISNITFAGATSAASFVFSEGTATYGTSAAAAFEVPYGANISCTVYVKDTKEGLAKFGLNGSTSVAMIGASTYTNTITLLEGTINLISIKAKAENGSEGTEYKIYIKRASGNTEYLLKTLSIDGVDVTFSGTSIDYCTYRGNPQSTIEFTVSTNAYCQVYDVDEDIYQYNTLSYDKNLQESKANTIKIKVISEKQYVDNGVSGASRTYTIRIYSADQYFSISNINLFSDNAKEHALIANETYSFDKDTTEYVLTGTYTNFAGVIIDVTKAGNSQNAVISGDLTYFNLAANVQKTLTITIKSEYASLNSNVTNQQATYTYKFTRDNPYTVNTLKDLWVDVDGTRYNLSPTFVNTNNGDYTVEYIPSGHVVSLAYTQHDGARQTIDESSNLSTSLDDPSTIEKLTIKVVPESGSARTYSVKVSVGQITLSKDNAINQLFVSEGTSNRVTFNKDKHSGYVVTVSYPVETVSAYAVLSSSSAKLFIYKDGDAEQEYASGEHVDNIVIARDPDNGAETTLKIVARAQDTTVPDNVYTVVIRSQPADDDTSLKIFTINGTTVTTNGQVFPLPYSQEEFTLKAETNSEKATITPSKIGYKNIYELNDEAIAPGERTINLTVTAESGRSQSYSVKIVRDDITTLNDLYISVKDKTPKANIISFTTDGTKAFNAIEELLYQYSEVVVEYTLTTTTPSNVKVTGAGNVTLNEGDNEVKIKIEAASGASTTYTVNIKRKVGETGNTLAALIPEEGDPFGPTGNTFTYVLPRSYSGQAFSPSYTKAPDATNATVRIVEDDKGLHLGLNTFHIEVTSEVGVSNVYTVNTYVSETATNFAIALLDSDNTSIPFQGFEFNVDKLTYDYTVAYSVKSAYLKVIRANDSKNSTIFVNGAQFSDSVVPLSPGLNTFEIYAASEYEMLNQEAKNPNPTTYTISITQEEANHEARLGILIARIGGTGENLLAGIDLTDTTNTTYTITSIGDAGMIEFTAQATVAHPKAVVTNGDKTSATANSVVYQKYLEAVVDPSTGLTIDSQYTHYITVTPEEGDPITYTIHIARGSVSLDNDNSITVAVRDSYGVEYLGTSSSSKQRFDADTTSYSITIPYGPQSYSIIATKSAQSPATVHGAEQYKIEYKAPYLNSNGEYERTHIVYATSQNGDDGTKYSITVKVTKPSSTATLSAIWIDNVEYLIDGDTDRISLGSVGNSKKTIDIDATLSDSTASVSGDLGIKSLDPGDNTFVITVTAQDGSKKNYTISIRRQYEIPKLSGLDVVGEQLLDPDTEKAIYTSDDDFDPDIKEYLVKVKYVTDTITIDAFVEEESYTVACSNATARSSGGTIREFVASLVVGTNNFTISLKSIHGRTNVYNITVIRRDVDSANTNIAKLVVKAKETDETLMEVGDYSSQVSTYSYSVPNSVRNLEMDLDVEKIADANGEGATYQVFNSDNLQVGKNQVIILVTAEDGETTRAVVINVEREPNEFDVTAIAEHNTVLEGDRSLSAFKTDFANDTVKSYYEVSTAVTSLDFAVANRDPSDTSKPSCVVINGNNLKVGDNNVKLIITATDGTVTEQDIVVKRLPMSYTVNKNAYEYACSETQGTSGKNYTISLGNKSFDAIDDYTKYIEFDASQMLTTEVISQSNSEVVVKVASVDNAEVEYVHFQIDSTANRGSTFDILFWIVLGLAVVLLVIILIFVNKDKYGAVSNSRKK